MQPGDPARIVMTKWGGRPHWEHDAVWLGHDEHGDWYGARVGTLMSRPGVAFATESAMVKLVPSPSAASTTGGSGWVASFMAASWAATYVDMTTVPARDGDRVVAVDLDLDVVRTAAGDVYVDDEDEFAEHRIAYGYPSEVVSLAEESCAWVLDRVLEERPPFDGAPSERWLSVLAEAFDRPRG